MVEEKKMEVNPQNIQQLAVYLQQTLSPQNEVRKPAEEFLQSVEVNQNYPVLLLHLLQSEGADLNIKVYRFINYHARCVSRYIFRWQDLSLSRIT